MYTSCMPAASDLGWCFCTGQLHPCARLVRPTPAPALRVVFATAGLGRVACHLVGFNLRSDSHT